MPNFLTVKVLAWIAGALGVVILGLSAALWAASVRIDDVKNDRDKAKNELTEAVKTIKGQVALLNQCDAATKKLDAEGKERQKAADKAVSDARKETARYQQANQKRDAALRAPTPPGAGCSQAIGAIRKELRK